MIQRTPYDPFAEALSHADWELAYARLNHPFRGITTHFNGVTYIILDDRLRRGEERAVLAHEIVHAERTCRGHTLPSDDPRDPLNRREERHCRLVAALRLVGLWPIVQMVLELRASGEFNPFLYAEDLGVPPRLLLDLLAYLGRAMGPIRAEWVA
jgi:hypothetical protein